MTFSVLKYICRNSAYLTEFEVCRSAHPFASRCGLSASFRFYCDASKDIKVTNDKWSLLKKRDQSSNDLFQEEMANTLQMLKKFETVSMPPVPWNERYAIKKLIRENSFFYNINCIEDLLRKIQNLNDGPRNFSDIKNWLEKIQLRRETLMQKHLPERRATLKADLAAAHFIISRGGYIKFLNQSSWMGRKEAAQSLPAVYMPGYLVEGIKAEGTGLMKEGLENISDLTHLSWLSLKGLIEIDDWCMDWITNRFSKLEFLELSGCKNVTHRALTCLTRLDSLKTLVVSDVSDTPEFKVACLMLQEVLPNLEINGIDLTIPNKIDSLEVEDLKLLPKDQKALEKHTNF